MPVRFVVALHSATPVAVGNALRKPQDFLDSTWGRNSKVSCAELLQSSLQAPAQWPVTQPFDAPTLASSVHDINTPFTTTEYLSSLPHQLSTTSDLSHLVPRSNGFVDTVVQAYNKHHHLIIRPDDVWLAILGQFNLYVNANAEALRSYFVAHEGKKELVVEAVGTRYTVDFGSLAKQMTSEIDKNVLDKELRDWILPNFTTTTQSDIITSAVMMMSTLKEYFSYTMSLSCGIPSVTLEGEREDWENLLTRIDRLRLFGKEPEAWTAMLRPILTRLVQAFDGKSGADFWNHACHYRSMGSGSDLLGGWITAFCAWNKHGKWVGSRSVDDILGKATSDAAPSIHSDTHRGKLEVDGIPFPTISVDKVPPGYCEVDVKLDDNGQIFDCMMVSGHMSMRIEGTSKDAVRPHPAWFMFVKGQEKKYRWE